MPTEVSILIPTKNRPHLLERLLKSLNEQSFLDKNKILCYIVDSSKNRDTKNMVTHWISNSKDNLYIDYEYNFLDSKPIDNWVLLLNKINSEYSKFMCDDDWLVNSAVEDFLKFIDPSIQCVISNINICFENSSSNVSNYYDLQTEIVEPVNVIDSFLGLKSSIPVTQSASLLKSESLVEAFNFSFKNLHCTNRLFGEDLTLNYFHAFKNSSTLHLNKSLVNSWAGKDSLTLNSNLSILTYCNILSLDLLVNEFNVEYSKSQKKALQHYLFTNSLKKLFNSDYGDIHYRGSIKPFPSTDKLYQYFKRKFYNK